MTHDVPPLLPSSFSSQLKHMMVMTGYPDFLVKPELIDQEYGVSSLCNDILIMLFNDLFQYI